DLMARIDLAFDVTRDVVDSLEVGDGCPAELHNDARHVSRWSLQAGAYGRAACRKRQDERRIPTKRDARPPYRSRRRIARSARGPAAASQMRRPEPLTFRSPRPTSLPRRRRIWPKRCARPSTRMRWNGSPAWRRNGG